MTRRLVVILITTALANAGFAYLRDPAWLLTTTSGLRDWTTDDDGTRLRWTSGHASFFIPSDWAVVEVPLRATFASPEEWPITATITIDDRPADRVILTDGAWRRLLVRMPPRASRRVRRIDIRLDRTREGNRGVQLGEVRPR